MVVKKRNDLDLTNLISPKSSTLTAKKLKIRRPNSCNRTFEKTQILPDFQSKKSSIIHLREIEKQTLLEEEKYFENLFRQNMIFTDAKPGEVNRVRNIGHSCVQDLYEKKLKIDQERDEL